MSNVIPLDDDLIEMLLDVRTYIADYLDIPVENIGMSTVGLFNGDMDIQMHVHKVLPPELEAQ